MKKRWIVLILVLALLAGAAGGLYWAMNTYVYIGGTVYRQDLESLDLRGQEVSQSHLTELSEKLPGCEILWDIAFQDTVLPGDAATVTVTTLSEEDIQVLKLLPQLRLVRAEGCTDYAVLAKLQEELPQCTVDYTISIGGRRFDPDAKKLSLENLTAEDMEKLVFFPELAEVKVLGCEDYARLKQLQAKYPQWNLTYVFPLGGQEVSYDVKQITAEAVTLEELEGCLPHLPYLETLELVNPAISAQALLDLREAYPYVDISWEVRIFDLTFGEDTVEADISGNMVEDLEAVEAAFASLPNLEKLIMSDCGIDNETMAAFRERQRENYKVVWTVYLSSLTKCRTDDIYFMPIQQGEYYLLDSHTPNLKYCEDMICIDVGHHAIHNIDFVAYMPHLKYLIIAHTQVKDISPIVNCQELIYLELDYSPVEDLTPLLEVKSLEDLNLNETYCDREPLKQMTWLKNLWIPGAGYTLFTELTEALPDTQVVQNRVSPEGQSWRNLPNYYAMRDLLGMHYMIG